MIRDYNRKYFKPIHMGAGVYTGAACYELHQQLESVLNKMGGLQQPPHSENEAAAIEHEKKYNCDIENLKKDILEIISDLGFTFEELMDCRFYKQMLNHNKIVDEINESK
jgi:hypothetical protein